jgi:hypothetical protein
VGAARKSFLLLKRHEWSSSDYREVAVGYTLLASSPPANNPELNGQCFQARFPAWKGQSEYYFFLPDRIVVLQMFFQNSSRFLYRTPLSDIHRENKDGN